MNKQFKTICFLLLLLMSYNLHAQNEQEFTISGQITDAANGEDIPFADIVATDLEAVGANTNIYGFYSLTLPAGTQTLEFRYLGYQPVKRVVELTSNMKINISLKENVEQLAEVVVKAIKEDNNITQNEGSITTISMKDVKALPSFGGEPDVMKVIELNPGVKTAGEGSSGFYVRGGGLDQNLILLDEAPVYNPSHVLGLFSVFNGDALKSASINKGGMSAEYGGRTASVVDMRMKDGNKKDFGVSGGIGLIASRLTIEGPIVKDKSSFIISGRRTYADLFAKLSNDESINNSTVYFYDFNAKINYRISEKDRLYLSGYFGRDELSLSELVGIDFGNQTATARWNHLFNDKLFSNTTFIYSDYDYKVSVGEDERTLELGSVIKDYNIKQDFTYFLNNQNTLKFGLNAIHHRVEPGNLEAGEETGIMSTNARIDYGVESAIYIQNEQKISSKLSLNYGLRYSMLNRIGEGEELTYNELGEEISATSYEKGELMQSYGGLEPRLSVNYLIDNKSSVKATYNRNYQYLHLLSNSTSSTPTDVWVMSSNNIAPQLADQVSLGYFRNLADNMYETSVELYYKDMQNTIAYKDGADVFLNGTTDADLVFGAGRSYGAEFSIRKTKGALTGWLSYTLSRTFHQFDEINNGEAFSARQDRIHDISLAAMYQVNKKWSLSANFIYYTGDAVSYPTGRYVVDGKIVPLYSERNGYRLPDYHRLDLGATLQGKKTKKIDSSWNFSLYNAYGRENAYSIDFQNSEENPGQVEAVQTSLFKWIPSATWNFKF